MKRAIPQVVNFDVPWALSLALALLASGISLCIAVEAGRLLGSSPNERLFHAGVGIVAVLGAHLLMPIFRQVSALPRLGAIAISAACIVYIVYGQTSYFLSAQAQAGAQRMAAAVSTEASLSAHARSPRRVASLILMELAEVKADLAQLRSRRCLADCSRLDAREAVLRARIAALEAEADEVRRWQQNQERLEARKAAVKDDPVTERLVGLLGVTSGAMGLTIGVLFALILEGTACLCWFFVLQWIDLAAAVSAPTKTDDPVTVMPSGTVPVPPVISPVTPEVPVSTALVKQVCEPVMPVEGVIDSKQIKVRLLVDRVLPEIKAGRVRPTVTGIREYLECARAMAAEVRRAL